jgi:perosamine synthetase
MKTCLVNINLGRSELKRIEKVIDSGWITQGPMVHKFEKSFAKYIGVKYAVATSSCTSALQICLANRGLGKKDEVITTPFTWESTITSIIYAGGTPVFADIDPKSLNISPKSIERKINKNTKGIVVVHFAGLPVDINNIKKIARKHNLFIIEDSAHALGSKINGIKTGNLANDACFSFGSTKIITTGEGGMITTNNRHRYKNYQVLRNYGENKSSFDKKGKNRWFYDITNLSYNFKMNELAAAVGIEQMKKLPKIVNQRIDCLKQYQKTLSGCRLIKTQKTDSGIVQVPLFFPIILKNRYSHKKLEIMSKIEKSGIETGIYYPPVYKLSVFKKLFKGRRINCPITEKTSLAIFSVPCHGNVSQKNIKTIRYILDSFF